ncbi:5-oxoprolinase subunit PxpB [Acetonema longum]|uniref:Allophanate hydrolase subunit 1 n=1 Tax=Acetonema longum DSM 6540 TaxID=1009370 RepID=F7NG30_9FIRM|nr:5-oxoprolinase subunit PxpB [Acetonema longum]EGO64948.1 Allophanate hydrolase subunit 1 [Acetonema longum DSM 6540]
MSEIQFLQAGDQGLVVEFGNEINAQINRRVHSLARSLSTSNQAGILEVVPTYRSLLVYFDPLQLSRSALVRLAKELLDAAGTVQAPQVEGMGRVVHIPVCYGGEFGPDLDFVAQHNDLSPDEVIAIHTSVPYQVYMLGFTPGFPYLGGMSEKIATPRLEKPRVRIPAGSVGIAGSQTGFYPVESPGGWQLIGRTPINGFDAHSSRPFAFAAGDYLQFKAVTLDEFSAIRREVEAGAYTPESTVLQRRD